MINWASNISTLKAGLELLSVFEGSGEEVEVDLAFSRWRDITAQVRETGKTVYLIGNGASASIASHIAADLSKNARLRTEVFTDLSLITAITNDISYEEVFAEPLRQRMIDGDMLVAISSSGQSPNIIKGARQAASRCGLVVTLSAMGPSNTLKSLGILNFYVPAKTYGIAEICHTAILHFWVDQIASATTQM